MWLLSLFPDRFNVHLRLNNGLLIHMQKRGIWSKPVFVGNDSDTDWGAVGHDERPPRICPSQLSLLWKKERAGLYPVGWSEGGQDKEHSREMALVKDWHRPPHWDVNLNRGSVGWGLSYSCWWDSRGFRAPHWCGWTGAGHNLMMLRASSFPPFSPNRFGMVCTFIFHFVW